MLPLEMPLCPDGQPENPKPMKFPLCVWESPAEGRAWRRGCGAGFVLLDAQGGEIQCTAFGETADRWDGELQVGQVITLSKASLKPKRNSVRASTAPAFPSLHSTVGRECAHRCRCWCR